MCNILVVSMIVLGSWPPCTVHIHIWHINKHPPYAYLSLLRHNNNNDNHFYFSFRRDILLFFSFWLTNMCIVNLCKLCPRFHCDYTQLFPMWLFFSLFEIVDPQRLIYGLLSNNAAYSYSACYSLFFILNFVRSEMQQPNYADRHDIWRTCVV